MRNIAPNIFYKTPTTSNVSPKNLTDAVDIHKEAILIFQSCYWVEMVLDMLSKNLENNIQSEKASYLIDLATQRKYSTYQTNYT